MTLTMTAWCASESEAAQLGAAREPDLVEPERLIGSRSVAPCAGWNYDLGSNTNSGTTTSQLSH